MQKIIKEEEQYRESQKAVADTLLKKTNEYVDTDTKTEMKKNLLKVKNMQ